MQHPWRASRTLVGAAIMLIAVPCTRLSAQATRPVVAETDLAKDPSGTPLLHLAKGTPLVIGAGRGGWVEATIDGWIGENALRDDKRDGFDISVSLVAGTTVRSAPGGGAVLASARLGALFHRLDARNGWVHVNRTGWIAASAVTTAPAAPPAAQASAAQPASKATISAGSGVAIQQGGSPVATLESPIPVDVVEHRNGWAHVRIDAWVRDGAL